MDKLIDISSEIKTTIHEYKEESNQASKQYREAFKDVINKFKVQAQAEKGILQKKQKISVVSECTETESSSSNSRTTRSVKSKASASSGLDVKLRRDIKKEAISEDDKSIASATNSYKQLSVRVKREKISVGISNEANNNSTRDSSIMVLPNEVNIITLSDDDDEKMPPPLKPPPKRQAPKVSKAIVKPLQENSESDNTDVMESVNTIKVEKPEKPKSNKRTKRTKKKGPHKPMIEVKTEKEEEIVLSDTDDIQQDLNKETLDKNVVQASANVTLESVYEDAKDTAIKELVPCETYVCGKPPTAPIVPDETFVTTNSTFSVGSNSLKSGTDNVPAAKDNVVNGQSKLSHSSLITEDDSDEESRPVVLQIKNKNTKELFNPYLQSPVQSKVAAFERQAQAQTLTPNPPVRQTRTKTRQLAKEKANGSTTTSTKSSKDHIDSASSKLPIPTTPMAESKFSTKIHTPLSKILTPKHHSQNVRILNSLKSSTIYKPSSAQPLKMRSRDTSAEDAARSKEALLEKKRKGDERLKEAQLRREANEKEKMEKYIKAAKEKKEREEARRLAKEQQKAIEKREKELRLKTELAAKLEQKQILAERDALIAQNKQNQETNFVPGYTFDDLNTDDSTDDESKVSQNRPNGPPDWSKRINRKENMRYQALINQKDINTLFSCQPTTPDLTAIFPQIDDKFLRRNSSAFWNTPPRYSQLPKY